MKKVSLATLVFALVLGAAAVGWENGSAAEPELRPSQVAMRARAGWVKAMGDNVAIMRFAEVKADALALSNQTKTIGEKQENPLAKELTLRVSSLASATADAAGRKDAAAVTTKLADIKATCAECHAKIRDKKM